MSEYHGTTILCVRRDGQAALAGDGQVTLGNTVIKNNAVKVRKIYNEKVLAGFAGAVADALTLFELFEAELDKRAGHLQRAAVELAKTWRLEKRLRRLDALLAVADRDCALIISGNGDVIEPDGGVVSIGSGSAYALAAARALLQSTDDPPAEIVRRSLKIVADICIYTNDSQTLVSLE